MCIFFSLNRPFSSTGRHTRSCPGALQKWVPQGAWGTGTCSICKTKAKSKLVGWSVGWLVQASKPNALSITCSHCTWPSCLYLPGCSFWQEALQHPSKPRRYGHRERLLLIAGSCCLPYCLLPRCQLPKCGLLHCLAAIVSRPLPLHPNRTAPHLLSAELTAVVPPVL